jgi:hypothetical protein
MLGKRPYLYTTVQEGLMSADIWMLMVYCCSSRLYIRPSAQDLSRNLQKILDDVPWLNLEL